MLYYILENKERKGPFSLEQLAEIGISPDTMVWCKGMANWTKASEVEELAGILTSNHVENIKCKECGELFNANLTECPNCGCPASLDDVKPDENDENPNDREDMISSQEQPSSQIQDESQGQNRTTRHRYNRPNNSVDLKHHPTTSHYYSGILRPWYVECNKPEDHHRFDTLNEILLLGNLCFRVSLWWFLFIVLAMVCCVTIILLPLGIYIFIKGIPWAAQKHLPMIHKLFVRLNQRYWLHMEYAKETNSLDDL